jgi:endonuclease/exonuclease/phosphatase family metal-dependent hydrolase
VPHLTLYHTKYSVFENQSACESRITFKENPASSGFSRSSFGDLAWNEDECCWTWNGQMSGGNNTNMITKDAFVSAMNEALPEFKSWLENNGELLLDQGGRYRGEDRWWPGAYQDGFIPADDVTVTTFNIRGSNIDEDETSRTWANRKTGVFAWFNENQHPFVLTQECSEDQRNEILSKCSAYDAVYYAGSSSWWDQILGRDTDAPVVTFYKKDEVTVHSSGTFWLVNGAPTTPNQATNQNQQRCATWMKCTYKDKKMVLINTHISYKTKNGATGDSDEMQALRESEMAVIKTWLSNNYNPSTDGPVVLAGDFNTSQGNSVFTYWRNNNDDCGWYYARDTMYANDKNACDIGRTFNNWVELGGPGQLTIDHQFYSGFSDVKSYLVDREPYAGVQFLSDHWPLTVVYEF